MLVSELPQFRSYTLKEFTTEAYNICNFQELDASVRAAEDEAAKNEALENQRVAMNNFAQFVLSGRHCVDPENAHTAELNVLGDMMSQRDVEEHVRTLRDYDSLLGWSTDLTYSKPLEVYVVPPFKETLKENLHIKVPIRVAEEVYFLSLYLLFDIHSF